MPEIHVELIHPDAKLPKFAHETDACADLSCVESGAIRPGETKIISTGIKVAMAPDYELLVRSRSGLAAKNSVFVLNSPGTIDSAYRNEIKIILHNAGDKPFEFKTGDRLAQLALRHVPKVSFVQVSKVDENTDRGLGGLGSTGIK